MIVRRRRKMEKISSSSSTVIVRHIAVGWQNDEKGATRVQAPFWFCHLFGDDLYCICFDHPKSKQRDGAAVLCLVYTLTHIGFTLEFFHFPSDWGYLSAHRTQEESWAQSHISTLLGEVAVHVSWAVHRIDLWVKWHWFQRCFFHFGLKGGFYQIIWGE